MKNITNAIRGVLYFIVNFFDFKFDFPFPPKFIHSILQLSYWRTFIMTYYIRKKDSKNFDNNVHTLWKNKKLPYVSYEKWLQKIFMTQHGSIVSDKAFDIMINNGKLFLDAGCGAGASGACFLMRYIDKKIINETSNAKIEYHGIDLNSDRIDGAKKFLDIFLHKYKDNIKTNLNVGDLSNINYEDNYFDYTYIPSVLERIDDDNIDKIIQEICRVTKKGIFVSDFFDHYPLGYPRDHNKQNKIFRKYNFKLDFYDYIMTKTYPESIKNQCELHTFFIKN